MAVTPTPMTGLRRVLSSRSVYVAVGSLVTALLVAFNAPPSVREHVGEVLLGIFSLATAVIASWGYQDGKLNEGTVPAGREPVAVPPETSPPAPVVAPKPAVSTADLVGAINTLAKRLHALEAGKEPETKVEQ